MVGRSIGVRFDFFFFFFLSILSFLKNLFTREKGDQGREGGGGRNEIHTLAGLGSFMHMILLPRWSEGRWIQLEDKEGIFFFFFQKKRKKIMYLLN